MDWWSLGLVVTGAVAGYGGHFIERWLDRREAARSRYDEALELTADLEVELRRMDPVLMAGTPDEAREIILDQLGDAVFDLVRQVNRLAAAWPDSLRVEWSATMDAVLVARAGILILRELEESAESAGEPVAPIRKRARDNWHQARTRVAALQDDLRGAA